MKRSLTIALLLVMVLALVGCNAATTPAAATEPAQEQTEAKAEATEPAGDKAADDKIVIGFANAKESEQLFMIVRDAIEKMAAEEGVEVICVDNDMDPNKAVQNADILINAGCDVVIDYNLNAEVNSQIKTMLDDAGVKMVALDVPAENENGPAHYAGNDNFALGKGQGVGLGKVALERWGDKCDLYISLETMSNGQTNEDRQAGILEGVRESITIPDEIVVKVDGKDNAADSQQKISDVLTSHPDCHNILIGCHHFAEAAGAVAAIETSNRVNDVLVGSVGPDDAMKQLIREKNPCFAGMNCIDFADFGRCAFASALGLARGEEVPMKNYVPSFWVDSSNIDEIFPE